MAKEKGGTTPIAQSTLVGEKGEPVSIAERAQAAAREAEAPKTYPRYRAHVRADDISGEVFKPTLHKTANEAVEEAVAWLRRTGAITVVEVQTKRVLNPEYVEVAAEPES